MKSSAPKWTSRSSSRPIAKRRIAALNANTAPAFARAHIASAFVAILTRSEEHTSELQSRSDLVCRLLLEKKKKKNTNTYVYQIPTFARQKRVILSRRMLVFYQMVHRTPDI